MQSAAQRGLSCSGVGDRFRECASPAMLRRRANSRRSSPWRNLVEVASDGIWLEMRVGTVGVRSFAGLEQSSAASTVLRRIGLDYLRLQAALREVPRVESEDEIRASFFGTNTECIVLGVGRYLGREADLDRFSPLSNEIDERADRSGSNVQPLQNFLVLGENILRVEPHKVF